MAIAVLHLKSEPSSDRWAAVVTPGARWYTVQTDGGFSYDWVDEDATDDEVREILRRLIRIGCAHLRGESEVVLSRRLKIPSLIVHTDDEDVWINLSIDRTFAAIFKRGRRSSDR